MLAFQEAAEALQDATIALAHWDATYDVLHAQRCFHHYLLHASYAYE